MITAGTLSTTAWLILGLIGLAVLGVTAARSWLGRWLVYAGSAAFCVGFLLAGLSGLNQPAQTLLLPLGLPWIGTHLRLDPLASFFLILLGLGGSGVSIFALGHARQEPHPERVSPFYPAFIASMALVIVADDAFTFLFAWELMSLTSWALVMAHHRHPATATAGTVYLVMAVFSGLALLLAFGLLAGNQGLYAFNSIRAHPPGAVAGAVVLIIALVGAGSKAGLMPLHIWLPLAHPAAPSHVSALMSGVMTKVAIYGFIRIAFDLIHTNDWWAGVIVLALGGATAVLGVLHALMERDLKRLLAYSTVENIGIVFIGLGLVLAFRANGFAAGAALALSAAMFHALNHTLYKSLLFCGAGALLNATGQRDIEAMGGLIHRMPRTALMFLVGCAAIAGLPPLNGFASEWLTFQAMLLHPQLPQWGLKLIIPASGAALALATALASACFVRAFGIVFLGRPRGDAAAQAQETDPWSSAAMTGFAALCLLAGLLPQLVIDALAPVTRELAAARLPTQVSNDWLTIAPLDPSRGSYNGLLVATFIAASALLATYVVHRLSRGFRRVPAWDCGFAEPVPANQYSAGSFAQPLRRVFGTILFQARDSVDIPLPGDTRPASITRRISDPAQDFIYSPLGAGIAWIAVRVNVLQFLSIRRYLGFVFAALVVLLLALTLWQ